MTVHIITDSGCDIENPRDPCLSVLPLTVTFGTTSYKDGTELSHERFYELLAESTENPVTSQLTPYDYEQELDRVLASDADEAVIVAISSKLSGTCQSAIDAAQGRRHVYVVDTLNLCIGQRVMVQYAVRLAHEGVGAAEIASELIRVRDRAQLVALLDTLEYLKRGGRIPKSVGTVGDFLSIKPVLGCKDGELVMIGQARGSKSGQNQLRRQVDKLGVDWSMPVTFAYTGTSDQKLQGYIADNKDILEGHFDPAHLDIQSAGAAIGTHAGPDAIGVGFFSRE